MKSALLAGFVAAALTGCTAAPASSNGHGGNHGGGSGGQGGSPTGGGAGGGAGGVGGGGGSGGTPGALTYYRDMLPLFNQNCLMCHSAAGPGQPRLDDAKTASAAASAIQAALQAGTMPPYPGVEGCNSYIGERRISDADKQKVYAWVSGGATIGDPATTPPMTPPEPPKPTVDGMGPPDRHMVGTTYTPTFPGSAGPNDRYWCHVLDTKLTAASDLIAARVVPGNRATVHHIILYKDVGGKRVADHQGATSFECDGVPGEFTHAWVPGSQDLVFPQGVGMTFNPEDKLLMQVHYHKHDGQILPDTSYTDFYFSKGPTPEHAFVVWTGTPLFSVPAHSKGYAVNASCTVNGDWRVLGVAPHMHQHATAYKGTFSTGGNNSCFIDVPRWDFGWQLAYWLKNPVNLKFGDKITTTCTYDNPDDKDVGFGESTTDEMCFGFTYVVAQSKPLFIGPINWFGDDMKMMCAN